MRFRSRADPLCRRLGLPQTQHRPGRVDQYAQPTHTHDLGDISYDLRTQSAGFPGGSRDVGDFHISEPRGGRARHGMLQDSPVPFPTLIVV
jgi:hypothetical protein